MARDKLITIRIEGDKRQAFGDLAKSQNTDTASLLYDFINQCLSGKIDIGIVTGKKQWIDKIDNQIGSDRIDKLEATTQRLDNRLDTIAKKLNDWIEAIDDRLTDSDQGLSDKITSLEHRLNALAIQLDSQEIDTDRQKDSQKENPDMEPLLKREREASIATSPLPPSPSLPPDEPVQPAIRTVTPEVSPSPPDQPAIETLPTVETVSTDSINEPGTDAIASIDGTVESVEPNSSIETVASAIAAVTDSKPWYTIDDLLDCHYPGWPETKEGLRKKALREHWPKRTQRGSKGQPYEYQAVLPE